MASLLDLPGVTTTTALFGAETADGQPIKKAMQLMSLRQATFGRRPLY